MRVTMYEYVCKNVYIANFIQQINATEKKIAESHLICLTNCFYAYSECENVHEIENNHLLLIIFGRVREKKNREKGKIEDEKEM